jgi:GntR family transcriptional regulator, transcriptional repressor for pyruvate dehydrogenase complex
VKCMISRDLSRQRKVQSKIRPITKISISEEIAQQIMDLISNGYLRAGQHLPSERELCKDFGCGRSSLREALRCLSIVGVLNARVGEGTSVAVDGGKFLGKVVEWRLITEKHDIRNLLEVRIALEGISASKAAVLRSKKALAELNSLIREMETAVNDARRFASLDLDFHIALAKAANNALLYDLISMIRGQLVRGLSTVLLLPRAMTLSHKEHIAIFNAIKRGDAEAARKAMQAHLSAALRRYDNATEKQVLIHDKASMPAKFAPTRL